MPLKMSRGDRKLLIVGGSIFVALIIVALLLTTPDQNKDLPTTYSAASEGAKGAYLLLKDSGYRTERWEQSPVILPDGKNTTLILANPALMPTMEQRQKLNAFVSSGGRLIATGVFGSFFLPSSHVVPDPLEALNLSEYKASTPSPITKAAPSITMAPEGFWRDIASGIPLYANNAEKAIVVEYPYGKGEVIWWASATPLTNAGITTGHNLEFFLASIGDKQTTHVLWDEYFHGYGRSTSPAGPGSRQIKWLFVQLGVLALAVILTYSRRSGPLRSVPPDPRLSPLEFVETLGGLYERAGTAAIAVDVYYQRFRYWLTRRLGISVDAPVAQLEQGVRERWKFKDKDFAKVLNRCESARHEYDLPPKEALQLVQRLYYYAAELKLFPAAKQEKQ